MADDKLIKLHQKLHSDNYDVPDLDTFRADMTDESKTEALYKTLHQDGYDMPHIDEFKNDMGSPIKRNSADFIYEGLFEDVEEDRQKQLEANQKKHGIITQRKKPIASDEGVSFADYQVLRNDREFDAINSLVEAQKLASQKAEAELPGLNDQLHQKDQMSIDQITDPILKNIKANELDASFDERYEKSRYDYFVNMMKGYSKEAELIIDSYMEKADPNQGARDSVFKIFQGTEFLQADPEDKEDMMEKAWEKYIHVAALYDLDYQSLKERKDQFLYDAMQDIYTEASDPYTPSIAGLKSDFLDIGETIKTELETPEMKAAGEQQVAKITATSGVVPQYGALASVSNDVMKKYKSLIATQKIIEDIMNVPETTEGTWKELWKGLSNEQYYDKTPFLSSYLSADRLSRVYRIGKKAEQGKPLKDEEVLLMQAFGALNEATKLQPNSRAFNVGKGVAAMLPYIGEFAFTMPVYTVGKKAAEKGITETIEKLLKKKIEDAGKKYAAKSLASKLGARSSYELSTKVMSQMIGALAQTAVNPQMTINNTLERMAPQVSLALSPEGLDMVIAIENNGEKFGEAVTKGFGMSYAEIFTETLGPKLMGTAGHIMNKVTGGGADEAIKYLARDNEWFKRIIIGGWMKKRGILDTGTAVKQIAREKLGWGGLIEEYLEEFVNGRMSDLITGDNQKAKRRVGALMPWNYNWDQEYETFLTVGLFGLPFAAVRTAKVVGEGKNTFIQYELDGKKKKVKIPKTLVSLAVDAGQGNIKSAERLSEMYAQEEVTMDQFEVLALIAGNESQKKKVVDAFTKTSPIKKEKDDEERKEEEKKVIEEKKVEVKTEDEKAPEISKELQPLAQAGLLKKDKKGEVIVPTQVSVEADIVELTDQLESLTPEGNQEQITAVTNKLDILTQYAEKFEVKKEEEKKKPRKEPVKKVSVIKKPTAQGSLEFVGEIEKKKSIPTKKKKVQPVAEEKPPEGATPEQVREWVSEHGTTDREIHQAWEEEKQEVGSRQPTPFEEKILETKFKKQSFIDASDISNITSGLNRFWFSPSAQALDEFVQAYNLDPNTENITEQDVVDAILSFPDRKVRVSSPLQRNLEKRYKDVTGRKIKDFQDTRTADPVGKRFKTWLDAVDPFPAKIGDLVAQWEVNKAQVPKEDKEDFEKYVAELKEARKETLGEEAEKEPAAPAIIQPDVTAPPIQKQYRGKIIYASTNTGKTTFAEGRTDVKDADDIMKEVLSEMGIEDERMESQPGLVAYENQTPEMINKFRDKLQAYADQGYTVLTSNNYSRWKELPDFVFLAHDPSRQAERTGEERAPKLFKQERDLFKSRGFITIPEDKYIGDFLITPAEEAPFPGMEDGQAPVFSPNSFFKNFKSEEPRPDEEIKGDIKDALGNIGDIIASKINIKKDLLPQYDDAYKKAILVELKRVIDGLLELGYNSIKALRRQIRILLSSQEGIDKTQMAEMLRVFDENTDPIRMYIRAVEIASKSKGEMKVKLQMLFTNPEFLKGGNAAEAMIKTFRPLWETIAKNSKHSREMAEKTFFEFAKQRVFRNTADQDQYNGFIQFYTDLYATPANPKGTVMREVINQLKGMTYDQAVSLFAMYESLELIEQNGLFNLKSGIEFRPLNSSEAYHEFLSKFKKYHPDYKYKNNLKGFASVYARLQDYDKEKRKLFKIQGTKPTNWFNLTPEERYEKRKIQYQADLDMLEDITGIDADTWSSYFSPQTKETVATVWQDGKEVEMTFDSYEELLKHDAKHRGYVRMSTHLARLLHHQVVSNTRGNMVAAKNEFIKFFLYGDYSKRTLNNLYKLSTSIKSTVGLSGRSVSGNRFSSFVLASDMIRSSRNYHHLADHNNVAAKHQGDSKIPISVFNGIYNPGTSKEAGEMSMHDFWVSAVAMFLSGDKEYNQIISQFADKVSIYTVPVDKYEVDEQWIADNKYQEKFAESVAFIKNIIRTDRELIKKLTNKPITPDLAEKMAKEFAYNWLRNINDLTEIFFGNKEQYESDIKLSKRGASTNSPGMELNIDIDGGIGPSFRHVEFNEWISPDLLGLAKEIFDGVLFMSGSMATKMAISMGSIYNKLEEYNDILDSTKSLYSLVDNKGIRGLTKVNFINIDVLAKALGHLPGGEIFAQIKDFLDKNDLDTVSFTGSGTKLLEEKKTVQAFDKKGKFSTKEFTDDNIINRDSKSIRVQQDLRHPMQPQPKKMSVQFIANILGLPEGKAILEDITRLQLDLIEDFSNIVDKDNKVEWIRTHLNDELQQDLIDLLDAGSDITEPATVRLFHQMLAANFNKKALNIPVNRVMSQEIPSVPGLLKGYRESKDKTRILPAQVAIGITGIRYAKKMKSRDEAMAYAREHHQAHDDLFEEGALKEWEFEEDGYVPGEYLIVTRIPAGNLNAHTVARATYFIDANMVMLDKESQARSGSDYDGDQRSIQVLSRTFKNGNSVMIKGDSRNAIANKIILATAAAYAKPENLNKIMNHIDVHAYDPTVNDIRKKKGEKKEKDFDLANIADFDTIRRRNIAGVKMKGIMANMSGLFSYAQAYGLRLKFNNIRWEDDHGHYIQLEHIVNDPSGMVKGHFDNLLNLSFDNAKDPKIDDLGLTPETANLFMMLIMFNHNIDRVSESIDMNKIDQVIKDQIDAIAKYFRQDYVEYIIQNIKYAEGAFPVIDQNKIEEFATKQFPDKVEAIKTFLKLRDQANQLFTLKSYQKNMHEAPVTSADFIRTMRTFAMVRDNKLSFLDTSGFAPVPGTPFETVSFVLSQLKDTVFTDLPEFSIMGEKVLKYIESGYKKATEGATDFTRTHLDRTIRLFHQILATKSIDNGLSFAAIRKETLAMFEKERTDDNLIYDYVDIISDKDNPVPTIAMKGENRFSKLPEDVLDAIHKDFDTLSDELKMNLARYIFYVYSPATGNMNGNFYNLFSNNFRAELSHAMRSEFDRWRNNGVEELEAYQVAEWVRRASKSLDAKVELKKTDFLEALANGKYEIMDINSSANAPYLLNMDALEDISQNDMTDQEASALMQQLGGDVNSWNYVLSNAQIDPKSAAAQHLGKLESDASSIFNPPDIKNHIPDTNLEELLLTDDPVLAAYTFGKLSKAYPGMKMFNDKESFLDYAERMGAIGLNTDPEAIGHAFRNAIYIDSHKATQSTPIHEVAHIYWEVLPASSRAKKALKDHFDDGTLTEEELEEKVIKAIGYAGVDYLRKGMSGSFWTKFRQLLKRFWNEVKSIIGTAKAEDYLYNMAHDVITNRRKIQMVSTVGPAAVKNMVSKSRSKDNDGKPDSIYFQNKGVISATKLINTLQATEFDKQKIAEGMALLNAREFKEHYNISAYESERKNDENKIMEKWDADAFNGSAVHNVTATVFDPELHILDDSKDRFINDEVQQKLIDSAKEILEQYKEEFGPNAKFYAERPISIEQGVAGIPDLVVELENGNLIIIDFKTHQTSWTDAEGNETEEYDKFQGKWRSSIPALSKNFVSKKRVHGMQLNIYAHIIEAMADQEGNTPTVEAVYMHQIVLSTVPVNEKSLENKTAGLIKSAEFVPHKVKLMRTQGTKGLIKNIINAHYIQYKKQSPIIEAYTAALKEEGLMPHIIEQQIQALEFFINADPGKPIQNIDVKDLERLTNSGWGFIEHGLLMNGFEKKHFDKMNSEVRFYAAITNRTPDQIFDTEGNLNKALFKEVIVREKTVRRRKRFEGIGKIVHTIINKKDVYLKQTPLTQLELGDEVVEAYPWEASLKRADIYKRRYTIERKTKTSVLLVDTETNERLFVPIQEKHPTFFKVIGKPSVEVKKDSFMPTHEIEIDEISRPHYQLGIIAKETELTDDDKQKYERQARTVWNFFERHSDPGVMEAMLADKGSLQAEYDKLRTVDEIVGGSLISFLQNQLMNHISYETVRRETKNMRRGKTMDLTMHLHKVMTDRIASFGDFGTRLDPYKLTPTRMIRREHHGLNLFTITSENMIKDAIYETTLFHHKFSRILKNAEKYSGGIDEENLWETINGVKSYKRSDNETLSPFEKEFIVMVEQYFSKFHPDFIDKISTSMTIPLPRVYMLREEFRDKKNYGKKYGSRIHDMLAPQIYDSVRLRMKPQDGREIIKTLRQIKNEFAEQHLDLEERIVNNTEEFEKQFGSKFRNRLGRMLPPSKGPGYLSSSALQKKINEAEKIYSAGRDDLNPHLRERLNRLPISGNANTDLVSKRILDVTKKVITESIERYYLSQVVPLYESLKTQYSEGSGILDYLKDTYKVRVLKQNPGGGKREFADPKIKEIMEWLLKVNSLNKIAFSVGVQKANLIIGQVNDIIREPGAWAIGIGRMLGEGPKSIGKAYNIAVSAGLANLSSEEEFQKMNKGIFGQIETAGYWMMDIAEKMNQLPIYVGLMTEAEWNSYNDQGIVINTEYAPSADRRNELENRVQEIHGDYTRAAAAPWMFTPTGRFMWQFGKFIPAVIAAHFAGHHLNRRHKLEAGTIRSVFLLGRVLVFKLKSDAAKEKALSVMIERAKGRDQKFQNTREYFEFIQSAQDKGNVVYKNPITELDLKNYMRLAIELAMITGLILLKKKDDDDDPTSENTIERLYGDLIFYIDPDYWKYRAESPIPAASIILGAGKTALDIRDKFKGIGRYEKNMPFARQGWDKWWISMTRVVPYGGAIKDGLEAGIDIWLRTKTVIGPDGTKMSKKEAEAKSKKYDSMMEALKRSKISDNIHDVYIDAYKTRAEAKEYTHRKKKEYEEVGKALIVMDLEMRMKADKQLEKEIESGYKIVEEEKKESKKVKGKFMNELKRALDKKK